MFKEMGVVRSYARAFSSNVVSLVDDPMWTFFWVLVILHAVISIVMEPFEYARRSYRSNCYKCALNRASSGSRRDKYVASPTREGFRCHMCMRFVAVSAGAEGSETAKAVKKLIQCAHCGADTHRAHTCWRAYFTVFWHYLDLLNLALFLQVYLLRQVVSKELLVPSPRGQGVLFVRPLQRIGLFYRDAVIMNAVNILLCWFKVFKYLRRLPRLNRLVVTLQLASGDSLVYLVIFLVVFLGFSFSFHIIFGQDIGSFTDVGSTMVC